MSATRGHGFRAVGFVDRVFIPPSGKVAFLTVAVPGRQKEQKIELRTFDKEDMIPRVRALGVGETVIVTAGIDSNKLINKAKQEVEVDGRAVWCMTLVIRTLEVEGAEKKADAPKGQSVEEQSKSDGVDW